MNIVGTSKIGEVFDLHSLAMSLEGAEYEPEQFPGLVYKLGGKTGSDRATFLLFSNGKIVCTGTKSEECWTCRATVPIRSCQRQHHHSNGSPGDAFQRS